MKKKVTLALAGFGVVGSGTMELLRRQKKDIEARVGARVGVKWLLSRKRKKSPFIGSKIKQTANWRDIIADREVDCVVELMGGTEPARSIILAALRSGKHVVTANKAVLSKYWDEVFGVAQHRHRLVYFEAAVGGGVPIIQALNEGLAGNEINRIVGILNGTTNFILTKMQESGVNYFEALKAAQAAGFAEANPAFDVQGIDAAQKLAILGSLAAGQWVPPERVHCEGISKLNAIDLRLVRERLNSVIKLLGIAEKTENGWIFRVHPTLVSLTHPFANVRNEYNAVSLFGNSAENVMLYGKGAGQMPTSSAVISDIIFLCRQIANGTAGQLPYVIRHAHKKLVFAEMEDVSCRYYLRVTTLDKPGVLAKITGILGRNHVSIASVHQDTFEDINSKRAVPIVLLTHISREADMQTSVTAINRLRSIKAPSVLLRME